MINRDAFGFLWTTNLYKNKQATQNNLIYLHGFFVYLKKYFFNRIKNINQTLSLVILLLNSLRIPLTGKIKLT